MADPTPEGAGPSGAAASGPSGAAGAPRDPFFPHADDELRAASAKSWWIFLVTGIAWLIFAMIVFRFDLKSVTAIGWMIGILCLAGGLNEFLLVGVTKGGWRILHIVLGVLFTLVGVVALVYPDRTFVEVAAIFSFFLLFKGIFDIVSSLIARQVLDLWWIQLVVGILELLVAFWAAGNFGREAVLLVVWAGAAALARGVTEIFVAIRLRGMRDGSGRGGPPPAPA